MDTPRWIKVSAVSAIIGGIAWLLMQVVLAFTGDVTAPLETALFAVGGVLLLVGSTGIGLWLFRPRARATQIVTVIASLAALLIGFVLSTTLTETIFGAGTAAGGGGGIVVVALLALIAGGLALRRSSAPSPQRRAATNSQV